MSFIKFYRYRVFKCNIGKRFMQVMIVFEGQPGQIAKDLVEHMEALGYKYIAHCHEYGTCHKEPEEVQLVFSAPGCIVPPLEALYERRRPVKSIQDVKEAGVL